MKLIFLMLCSFIILNLSLNLSANYAQDIAPIVRPIASIISPSLVKERFVQKKTISDITSQSLEKYMALRAIKASVRVKPISDGNSVGSGVVIFSEQLEDKYYSYVLTCHHVVGDVENPIIEQFIYRNNQKIVVSTGFKGEVLIKDDRLDLALVELITDAPFRDILKLASEKDIEDLTLYDPVYVVGCALGDPPGITEGHIINFDFKDLYQISAPVIFGNSGGASILASGKIFGIVSRVRAVRDPTGTAHPYPSSSLSVPAMTITKWLIRSNYGFLINLEPGSLEKSIKLRKELKDAAAKEALEKAKEKATKEAKEKALKDAMKKLEKSSKNF